MTTFVLRYGLDGKSEKTHEYSFLVTPEEMTKTHTISVKSDDPCDGFDDGYTTQYSIDLNFADYDPNEPVNNIKSITLSQKSSSLSEYNEEHMVQEKSQETIEKMIKENSELEIILKYEKNDRNDDTSSVRMHNIRKKISSNLEEIKNIKNGTCEISHTVTYNKKNLILPRDTPCTMNTLFRFYRFSTLEHGKVNFYWHFLNAPLSLIQSYNCLCHCGKKSDPSEQMPQTTTESHTENKTKTIPMISRYQKRKYT